MLESQPASNPMRSTDFNRQLMSEDSNFVPDLRQGKTFDKYATSQHRIIHTRTRSMQKTKIGKTASGYRRKDLNPNNIFLRQPPSEPEYVKDPTNKFMKKPFLENLPTHQKNFYANKKGFLNLFEDITKINLVFGEVIETVLCYRPKLAQTLSNLNLSYNKLYERLLDQNHKSEIEKDKELKLKLDSQATKQIELEKAELNKKLQAYEQTILAKKSEIKAANLQEEELKLEIFNLKSLIQEMQQFKEPIKDKKEDKPEDDVADGEKIFDKMGKDLGDAQSAIADLEEQQTKKKEIFTNIERLLKEVLQHTKQDQCIQVDEANLQWTPENMISKVLSQPLAKVGSEENVGIQASDEVKGAVQVSTSNADNTAAKDVLDEQTPIGAQEAETQPEKEKYKDMYKYEAPTANLTKGEEVTNLKKEEEKINEELGLDLNSQPKQQKSNRVVDIATLKQMALELTEQWNIPSFIIAFISNSLDSEEKGRVVPWTYFKKQMFEIYSDRIASSPEINGAVNSNYLSLEEYLILYFLKKHKLRRLAEVKLIEFISSLKYYTKIWPRAKVFAKLTGMLQYSEPIETDASSHSCDIFMQEFFYYAYTLYQTHSIVSSLKFYNPCRDLKRQMRG